MATIRDNRQAEAIGSVGIVLLAVAVIFAAVLLFIGLNHENADASATSTTSANATTPATVTTPANDTAANA